MKALSGLVELHHELGPAGLASNMRLAKDMKARNMKSNDYVGYLEHLPEFVAQKGEMAQIRKMVDDERKISAFQIGVFEKEVEESSKKAEGLRKDVETLTSAKVDATTKLNTTNDELTKAQDKLTFIKSEELPRVINSRMLEIMQQYENVIHAVTECVFVALQEDFATVHLMIDILQRNSMAHQKFTDLEIKAFQARIDQSAVKIFKKFNEKIYYEVVLPKFQRQAQRQ